VIYEGANMREQCTEEVRQKQYPRPTRRQVNDTHAILESAGFHIRGTRADCPYCEGHSRLTVSIRDELFFCHRCHRGGSVRQLAREQGRSLPPLKIRKANMPKAAFRAWLVGKMTTMMREEHTLLRRYRYALDALQFFPEMQEAWTALADYYHRERYFQLFWTSANDSIGRYWLYRAWRQS
jgi:hypothetical protein